MKLIAPICALLALAEALFLSRAPGPVVSPDAASYLCAAECLARGQAPRVPYAEWNAPDSTSPLHHFPPGFPAAAALPAWLGAPIVQAARWVEALAFAATAAFVAVAAGSAAGPIAAGLAAAMVMLTPAIAGVHVMVLSEPLFLALLALLLARMVRAPERALSLGVIAAAAVLVRYAAVSLIAAAALFAALQPGAGGVRIRRACLAAAPGFAALAAWRLWAGPFRSYGYKPGASSQAGDAWQTIAEWIVPALEASWLRSLLAGALLIAIGVWAIRSRRDAERAAASGHPQLLRLQLASLVIAGCYSGILVGSRIFADPDIPFDWRLMSPIALLVETWLAAEWVSRVRAWSPPVRAASAAALVLWLAGSTFSIAKFTLREHAAESPNSPRAQLSRWLREEGAEYTLYSNDPTAVYHLAHRSARLLPRSHDPIELERFDAALRRTPSALLGFRNSLEDNMALPSEIAERSALGASGRFDGIELWVYGGSAAQALRIP